MMNWNPFTWFRSEETVAVAEPEAPEAISDAEAEVFDPILEKHKPNGKYVEHDARATAAEEELRQAMEDLKGDGFDEKMNSLTIGTESLSQEQIRSVLGTPRKR